MTNFINNWRKYVYGLWLGGSVPIVFGARITDIRFWLVVFPTMLFVTFINDREADVDVE
jgi:hypothetical protein